MSDYKNFDEILGKVQEMRGFFKIGDEVIPFLGDLFLFLKDIMPLMADVNASMQDSANKLPTASDKIATASETAELATHEIMDKLDSITSKLGKLSNKVQNNDKVLIDEMQGEISDTIHALQFQDITAQQLEHANRILTAIYEKFNKLFNTVDSVKVGTKVGYRVIQAIETGIDENRREKEKEEFENQTKDVMRHESISQDDIDQLFS